MASIWYIGPSNIRTLSNDDAFVLTDGNAGGPGEYDVWARWSKDNGWSYPIIDGSNPVFDSNGNLVQMAKYDADKILAAMPDEFRIDSSSGFHPRPNSGYQPVPGGPGGGPAIGDSGWRRMLFNNNTIALYFRRIHDEVSWVLVAVEAVALTWNDETTAHTPRFPQGFQSDDIIEPYIFGYDYVVNRMAYVAGRSGDYPILSPDYTGTGAAPAVVSGTWSGTFHTAQDWPSVLPGTEQTPPQSADDSKVILYTPPVDFEPGTTRDSGWRDITHDLMDDADPGFILARRKGDHVTLMIDPYNQGGVTPGALGGNQVSAGFRPSSAVTSSSRAGSSFGINVGDDGGFGELGDGGSVLALGGDGIFQTAGMKHPSYVGMGRFDYPTDDAWPDPLPGVQVTPPSVIHEDSNIPVGLADTGWRGLAMTMDGAPYDAGSSPFQIRRVGNYVEVVAPYLEPGANKGLTAIISSAGFAPATRNPDGVGGLNALMSADDRTPLGTSDYGRVEVGTDGSGAVSTIEINGNYNLGYGSWRASWFTDDSWPTTLPGNALTNPTVQPVQPVTGVETRDTGWRNLGNVLAAYEDMNLGVQVRRVGNFATVRYQAEVLGLIADFGIPCIPVGFRPTQAAVLAGTLQFVAVANRTTGNIRVPLYGSISVAQDNSSQSSFGSFYEMTTEQSEGPWTMEVQEITFHTDDPWPVSLPGTAYPPQ